MYRILGADRPHAVRGDYCGADAPPARAGATCPALEAIGTADSKTARRDADDVPRKRPREATVFGARTRLPAGAGAMRSRMDERAGTAMVGSPRTRSGRKIG